MTDTTPTPTPATPAAAPATPAAPAAPAPAAPVTAATLAPTAALGSPEYGRAVMAAALVANGTMTEADAKAQLAPPGDPAAPAPQADAAKPVDAPAAAEPDALPAALDSDNDFERMTAAQQVSQQLEGSLQALGEASVDPGTAKFFGGALNRALRDPPSRDQLGQQAVATRQHLEQLHGKEQAQKIFDAARAEVRELEKSIPNLGRLMDKSGASHDAYTLETLARRQFERARSRLLAPYKQ